ncbi:helix-turn-helix transcriptional regulator [Anaerolineae bacterium CFX7]|nr:helix-turn-helix transcriptional regulator [Anaerolineae bacterium CFX7]
MTILQKFGRRVRELRQAKGLSQEKLAELANLHRTYISSVELGERNVSLKNIEAFANALDVSITELFVQGPVQARDISELKRKKK